MRELTGEGELAFFDAIAPIVYRDSIDMDKAWFQSRWNKGDGTDYINCPLNREQYEAFVEGLLAGEKSVPREWENVPYFEGCMPIEVMAERGEDTLRYGPMKPVGLDDPRTGRWPYAVVQLRQDNALGTLLGAVILGVLQNGLVMLSVPYYAMDIIKGLVLALALALALATGLGLLTPEPGRSARP